MTEQELIELCSLGESTTVQYKLEFTTQKQIANEQVRPVIYIETETVKHEGMAYVVAYVKNGIYKPYKDLSGNIWVKQGSDNRIEIVNPGCLPDGQTVDEMLLGNSDPRNPLLAQFGSNTMPYRGLGSGIPRVMATGSDVELIDRPDGNQFVARIWRTTQKDEITTQKSETTTPKPLNATQKKILAYLHNYPKATRKETADALGDITEDGVKFNIGLLQQYGALKRKGGRKNGEWEVNPDYFSEFIEITI